MCGRDRILGGRLTKSNDGFAVQAKLFHGLSDISRLSILQSLRNGAASVSQIVQVTGLSQSNASNHLSCLRNCGLVRSEQRGRNIFYMFANDKIGELLTLVESITKGLANEFEDCTTASVSVDLKEP